MNEPYPLDTTQALLDQLRGTEPPEPQPVQAELLPCPFCGSQFVKEYTDGDGPLIGQAVRCLSCGSQTRVNTVLKTSGVERWNTRLQPGSPEAGGDQ